jgi:hypothetical protein
MANASDPQKFLLRNLPLPVRLTLAMFLIAAGVGYLTGLIQLHFAHASPGHLLPTPADAAKVYHGQTGPKMTQLERLLETPASAPFNGTGSMRPAFLEKSDDWQEALKQKPETQVRQEREGERLALLEWVRAGAPKKPFDDDSFPLPPAIAAHPVTPDFLKVDEKGEAQKFPLEKYEQIIKYQKEPSSGAMSLERLASITHTHMMAFAVLFGCTGLLFAFTSYPAWLRGVFGPWTLFFQVLEIVFWWLSRIDPLYAEIGVAGCGALVGLGLAVQVIGGLFDLFKPRGKLILALLILLAAGAAAFAWQKAIGPYLQQKALPAQPAQ